MTRARSNKALVIVESPAKAKTINKYLGEDFVVKASMGHVRDLPSKVMGVDLETFEPEYVIIEERGKDKVVKALKKLATEAPEIYLATDLDREGEAIAWHLKEALNIPDAKAQRVIFNAITKSAIQQAFAHPGRLDMDKVMAQQARRVLDRIVGYQISPLLWKKVTRGLSAGRVQSVAVKIIVDREREIRQFKPEEYWLIPAVFSTDLGTDWRPAWQHLIHPAEGAPEPSSAQIDRWLTDHHAFKAELVRIGDAKFNASNEQEVSKVFAELPRATFTVAGMESKESVSQPSPPFITSTLQQAAVNRLGFSAKRAMTVAQQLYEGIDVGSMGSLGLITYMRTDSAQISPEAIQEVRQHIRTRFGDRYLPKEARVYTSSNKNAQEAHEAIRPTDVDMTPADLRSFLSDDQYKLYDLIWRRFVASQMPPARWNVTTMDIQAPTSVGICLYKATGRVQVFDGYTQVWPVVSNEQPLPPVQSGQRLGVVDIRPEQHFTKPPARYTEASLVKALEKEGIGRPSTYATIISTIQDRRYVEQMDKKFHATDLGEVVTDKLNEYFPTIMDVAFTRFMEEQLDKIAEQHLDWVGVLTEFYGPFKKSLETAQQQMKHAKAEVTPSEYTCTQCGKPMVYRLGKNGRFLSCSGYPECKFASPCDRDGKRVQDKVVSDQACPVCHKPMVLKRGRFGEFLGCSDYPQCKTTLKLDKQGNVLPPKPPPQQTGIKCYKCKEGELVVRQSKKGPFLGCARFPRCRTIVSIKQLDHLKELQASGQWPPTTREQADALLGRKPKSTSVIGT